jgi:hypothetical protein
VKWNESTANNRLCLAGIGEVEASLRVSGTGLAVVNADSVSIRHNDIHDNVPSVDPSTLQFPAGGLALVSLPPFNNAGGVDPGPVEQVTVTSNSITGNVPVDVLLSSPAVSQFLVDVGEGIEFDGNTCDTSLPPDICSP